jgi:Animal haem peroxidase
MATRTTDEKPVHAPDAVEPADGTAAPREAPVAGTGYHKGSIFWNTYDFVAHTIDRFWGWDRLPVPVGLLVLVGLRDVLRRRNLVDTSGERAVNADKAGPADPAFLVSRTLRGTYNDVEHPRMGMAGSRFGRNVPIDKTWPEPDETLLDPNPRLVSRELLTRSKFQPATSINLIAAAWIQFMIKDWFSHGQGDKTRMWSIAVAPDDPWPDRPMRIPRTVADSTDPAGSPLPPTYLNTETHWWDASQIYGIDDQAAAFVRANRDGKLLVDQAGRAVLPDTPDLDPTIVPGWWLGLGMMRDIFTREHNAICDHLRESFPAWSDEDLFQRARLINAALIAKIHTVDWTPAVISHPTTVAALRTNWFGIAGERINRALGRISGNELISGIPGSDTNHYGVPYALTEEFTAVYRMHPLVPDSFDFRAATDDALLDHLGFRDIAGPASRTVFDAIALDDIVYTFGTSYPGAIVLNNYPRFLQEFERPDGRLQDLGATDILRIREVGVPRYNEFRRLIHLTPARSFEDLTDNPAWVASLRRVYKDNIERVDLMTGMFAERRPKGFAFSDTAFRIFILMASRRLNSDRFLTSDYTPDVYTPEGIRWLENNNMATVLVRHFPKLAVALRGRPNAFVPWNRAVLNGAP